MWDHPHLLSLSWRSSSDYFGYLKSKLQREEWVYSIKILHHLCSQLLFAGYGCKTANVSPDGNFVLYYRQMPFTAIHLNELLCLWDCHVVCFQLLWAGVFPPLTRFWWALLKQKWVLFIVRICCIQCPLGFFREVAFKMWLGCGSSKLAAHH